MFDHTKEDVSRVVDYANAPGIKPVTAEMAHMLGDLLERIEADERAVPVAVVSDAEWGKRLTWLSNGGKDLPPVGTKLFTHPPAQAAQVDRYRELCGAVYQAAGAYNLPVRFLDALSDAAMGKIEERQKTDSLLPCYAPTDEPAQEQPGWKWVNGDTGNADADRVIGRLMSSDPNFDDCESAAILIRRLVCESDGPKGYATWKDAAIAERLLRVKMEKSKGGG